MDDQFNGRTDDDLFADDFEPMEAQEREESKISKDESALIVEDKPAPSPAEPPGEPSTAAATPSQSDSTSNTFRPSLAQSRHAKPEHHTRPRKHSPKPAAAAAAVVAPATAMATATPSASAETQEPPGDAPNTPTTGAGNKKTQQVSPAKPGQNTALADRLASGANPRTKLTDSELAAKMEQMRILAAEKTRRFEQAERDSRSHAIAYEKGMEEARRRRAEEAERRRRGDEEKRRMDEERAANRERKLKAMGAKEGGSWDEGKAAEEERDRRAGFFGANGGVRGARGYGSLANSRFAERDDAPPPPREFGVDDFRGGRGRGGRGRGGSRGGGRGGRGGGFNDNERPGGARPAPAAAQNGSAPKQQRPNQAPPTADDFPALPTPKKLDTSSKTMDATKLPSLSPGPNSPPVGKWDEEMAAFDAKEGA
ncbi:hypothetical protein GGR54DRAFT_587320 [Hypoxylon sp. NC1633]|nr:hypothetical protein GGR54DRAFT_587320 [Hypoxylon sp. NC1633]